MEIYGVVYTSRATQQMSSDDIDRLLLASRASNSATGITGLLLYGDGRFFQYFEGSKDNVEELYARIRNSRLHEDMVDIEYGKVAHRLFRKWFMGFRGAPTGVIQELNQQQWVQERPWMEDKLSESPGMQLLLKFADQDPSGSSR